MFNPTLKTIAGITVAAACLLAPAIASASCEAIAGEHHGSFTVDKRSDIDNGGHPDHFDGKWTATIDAATCAMTGTVTSNFAGPVAVKGTYGIYNPDTSKFKTTNLYMDAADNADYVAFVFETDTKAHLLHNVRIETADYAYEGSFDGK